jgi:hypothetical protein
MVLGQFSVYGPQISENWQMTIWATVPQIVSGDLSLRVGNQCTNLNQWCLDYDQDWVAQTSIKFKSQLNLKCKLIPCTFQVILSRLSFNWPLNLNNFCATLSIRQWP